MILTPQAGNPCTATRHVTFNSQPEGLNKVFKIVLFESLTADSVTITEIYVYSDKEIAVNYIISGPH